MKKEIIKRELVHTSFFFFLLLLSFIPIFVGERFEHFCNSVEQCFLFWICANKFTDWIFGKRKDEEEFHNHNKKNEE